MGKLNPSKGNMYNWVTHTWSPISGCPHQCTYCYVRSMPFMKLSEQVKISLPFPSLGDDKTIFVGHMGDLWADGVNSEIQIKTLAHCFSFPKNIYVFQTKNPKGYVPRMLSIPRDAILGCTIETNRDTSNISKAPTPKKRAFIMSLLPRKTFITIEPIMDFDVTEFIEMIVSATPDFVNIGADSKKHNLSEPSKEKIIALIEGIKKAGIEIREKHNLERLIAARQKQEEQ